MNNKVFIIEPLKKWMNSITKDLEEYGEVVQVFTEDLVTPSVFASEEWCAFLMQELTELGFDSKEDFIAVVGPTNSMALTMALLFSNFKKINLLFYRPKTRKYERRKLCVKNLHKSMVK